jgi:hypothetical protein
MPPDSIFDEIYTPIVHFDSLRVVFAVTGESGWRPHQLDVQSAFPHGDLEAELYITLPEGRQERNKIAQLRKCIYRLTQFSPN